MLVYDLKCRGCGFKGEYYDRPKYPTFGCLNCKKIIEVKLSEIVNKTFGGIECFSKNHNLVDYGIEINRNWKNKEKDLTCPNCGKKTFEMVRRPGKHD